MNGSKPAASPGIYFGFTWLVFRTLRLRKHLEPVGDYDFRVFEAMFVAVRMLKHFPTVEKPNHRAPEKKHTALTGIF